MVLLLGSLGSIAEFIFTLDIVMPISLRINSKPEIICHRHAPGAQLNVYWSIRSVRDFGRSDLLCSGKPYPRLLSDLDVKMSSRLSKSKVREDRKSVIALLLIGLSLLVQCLRSEARPSQVGVLGG